MSQQGWVPGAKAVIVCSEHFENMNRVVLLVDIIGRTQASNHPLWRVEDGGQFKGYCGNSLPERVIIHSDILAIEQWKMRLLGDDEETTLNEFNVEYVTA